MAYLKRRNFCLLYFGILPPGTRLEVGTLGRRAFDVPIAPRTSMQQYVGSAPAVRVKLNADALGRSWRAQGAGSQTSERIYDPREYSTDELVLSDLQGLGKFDKATTVRVVDPFGLDETALRAIAALVAGQPSGVTLEVLTRFEDAPGASVPPTRESGAEEESAAIVSGLARREERYGQFAGAIEKALGIHVRLLYCEGVDLHDRFLIIGERIWHVGHSFNAIGGALSAIVEMRDIATKARLLDILDPLFANAREVTVR